MRLRAPSRRPLRRPKLRTISVLPTLITTGNLLAGVLALAYLQEAAATADVAARAALWDRAAWMIFLGMFCDVLDGRIARLTRSTSAFGAQLDSLADVVTFGVAPAMLARSLLAAAFPALGLRFLTALVLVYVVGTALRLARYNVESTRLSLDGPGHVTLVFRGLPSPAAAGVVASLVLLGHRYHVFWVDWAILLTTPALGLLMLSRLPYPHLLNRFLEGSRPIPSVALLVVTVFLSIAYFLETVAAAFLVYAASGMALHALARLTGGLPWALHEEHDEREEVHTALPDAEDELGGGGSEAAEPTRPRRWDAG